MDRDSDGFACPADYTSEMLQLYVGKLEQQQQSGIVDLGPVCAENIMFFANRVKRHYVCDLFIRLDRQRRKRLPFGKLWDDLDYPKHNFNGIHLWDFLDRLDDSQAGRLLHLCHLMLKPGGMMMLTGFEESAQSSIIYSFVTLDNYRLTFRPQHHLDLPLFYRSNRELTALLSKFRLVKSFLYRNGVREFFFQRN
ncbi:MAG: hypothetical protein JRF72_22845 [Deltaproteobacteria bacterium]|nr:hypothetical protein [Deltaproteobacteria bacterium]